MNEYIVEELEERISKIKAYLVEIREFHNLKFEDLEVRNAFYKSQCMTSNLVIDIYNLFDKIEKVLWSIEND